MDALRTLFRQLPPDLGLAYVVIVHLAPDHPSALHQILGNCTKMPVSQVEDSPTLKPNCVYVIPPNRQLVIEGDSVTLRAFDEPRGQRAPIDFFFRSVASGRGDGMAILLSGAGADGSNGIRAIKEAGGVVFVQEPAEAQFPSMPQSAIATGAADFVAPLLRLVEQVREVAKSKEAVRSLDMDGAANDLRRIINFLRVRTGHDFSSYKRATVMRRVQRRMQVCQVTDFTDYADHLRESPEEAHALFADLLISVTQFFRDGQAFEELARQVVEPLFNEVPEDGLRAWVVGCATGEEAFSLAMLMLEEAARRKTRVPIQIFATDLDEGALTTAREGRYPRSIEADVSEERLKRFFVNEGTHYRVRKELRELVLFASHSVLKDPPFMRLDLISCRNLLIYLERSLQTQVASIFHYGLKPNRFLFLGSAESMDSASEQFNAVDREARIYRARAQATFALPVMPQVPSAYRGMPAAPVAAFQLPERVGAPAETHAAALEHVAPPSVLVDERQNVVHLSPSAGRFILHSAGPISSRLSGMVRPELRLDLKLALDHAFEQRLPTLTHPVVVDFDGSRRRVAMHVTPILVGGHAPTQALVFFVDAGPAGDDDQHQFDGEARPDEMRRLHAELKTTQEALLANRNEHEASEQELRAANEELQSINEEYRSTSEELETSKEELQSINEELQTVNGELKAKLEDISAAHNDLENLTASSEIGTLFLDLDLKIRMFTPPVANLINVTPADTGRPITDFTHRLDYDGMEHDVRKALHDLTPIEKELRSFDARWFMMRVRLYRTIENKVEGAVVTFDDITARKHNEETLRENGERQAFLLRLSDALGPLSDPIQIEGEATRLLGEHLGAGWCYYNEFDDDGTRAVVLRDFTRAGLPSMVGVHDLSEAPEFLRLMESGSPLAMPDLFTSPYFDAQTKARYGALGMRSALGLPLVKNGRLAAVLLVVDTGVRSWAKTDIVLLADVAERTWAVIERRRIEAALRSSEERFRAFVTASSDVVYRMSPDWTEMRELDGRGFLADTSRPSTGWMETYIHPDDQPAVQKAIARAISTKSMFELEHKVRRVDGSLGWTQSRAAPILDDADEIVEWLGTASDVTERREAVEALRDSEERLRAFGEASTDILWIRDAETLGWTYLTPAFEAIYGLSRDKALAGNDLANWIDLVVPEDRDQVRSMISRVRDGEHLTFDYRIRRPSDGEVRWLRNTDFPIRDADGHVSAIGGVGHDATQERKAGETLRESEARLQVMVAELHHRTRNLLGIIGVIMHRMLASSPSLADFRTSFSERLEALSRVQSLLGQMTEDRIDISDIVRLELDALGADVGAERVTVAGQPVPLRRSMVQTLALAIHELATNARKYGALRSERGRLAVRWEVYAETGGGRRLRFTWTETGIESQMVAGEDPPPKGGYGRKLIEEALPYSLRAVTTYTLGTDRLDCTVDIPLDR